MITTSSFELQDESVLRLRHFSPNGQRVNTAMSDFDPYYK